MEEQVCHGEQSQEAGGREFLQERLRQRQQELDFEKELKRMMEVEKLRMKEADMMELRAQEVNEQEFRFQQELLNDLKRQVEEEVKKGNEEQMKVVQQQHEKEEAEKSRMWGQEEDMKKKARGKLNEEEIWRNDELEDKKQKEAEGKQIGGEQRESEKLEEDRRKIAELKLKEEVERTIKEKEKRKQIEEEDANKLKQIKGILQMNEEEEDRRRKDMDGKLKVDEEMMRQEEEDGKQVECEYQEKWWEGEVWEKEVQKISRVEEEEKEGEEAEENMRKGKEVNRESRKEASILLEEGAKRRMEDKEESRKSKTNKEIDHQDNRKKSKSVAEKCRKTEGDENGRRTGEEEGKSHKQMKEEARITDKGEEEMTTKIVVVEQKMKKEVEKQLEQEQKKGDGQKQRKEEDEENSLMGEQRRKESAAKGSEDEEKRKTSAKQDVRMKTKEVEKSTHEIQQVQQRESEVVRKIVEKKKRADVKLKEKRNIEKEEKMRTSKEEENCRDINEYTGIEEELRRNEDVEEREKIDDFLRQLMKEAKRKKCDEDIWNVKELKKREERKGGEVKVPEKEKREEEKMKQNDEMTRVIEGEEIRNSHIKKERGEEDKDAKEPMRKSHEERDVRRLTRNDMNENILKNNYDNKDDSNQMNSHHIVKNRMHEQINENIQQHSDENIHQQIHGSIHWNIHENTKNNTHQKINGNVHEDIHETIHENIDENTKQNIFLDVHKNIDENTHHKSDDNIHENIHQNFSSQSGSPCLSQLMDQRRLSWTKGHLVWTELRNRSRRSSSVGSRRESRWPAQDNDLPPLCPSTLLRAAARTSLQEVNILVLEDLPGCSLSTLAQCARLQSLTLRRCGLKCLEGISHLEELCYVDVQENNITRVDCENMSCLRVLKLGYNKLASIHGLRGAENLHLLELSHNSITRIAGLSSLRKLQRLCLDHNQLVSTKGLRDVCSLLHLNCSHNHLVSAEGLESNVLLRTLDLTSNSLTEPPALHDHVLLGELRLDDNSLASLRHLIATSWLPHLHMLTLAHNRLTHLPNMAVLISLANLDLRFNCLSDVKNICQSLEGCCSLKEVHIAGNPLQKESSRRCILQSAQSSLRTIDGTDADILRKDSAVARHIGSDGFLSLIRTQRQQIDELQLQHSEQLSKSSHPLEGVKLSCRHSAEALCLAEDQRRALECFHVDQTSANQSTSEETVVEVSIITSGRGGARPFCDTQASTVKGTDSVKMVPHHQEPDFKSTSFTSEVEVGKTADEEKGGSTVSRSNVALHRAATVIQARWRGFCLRKKLAAALAAVTSLQTDDDDAFEVVDVEEFVLDEEMLEQSWTLCEDAPAKCSSVAKQASFPQLPGSYSEHSQWVRPPQPKRRPMEAWEAEEHEDMRVSPQNFARSKSTSTSVASDFSEKSDRILDEWGFTNRHTAELMLKRAQKMKSKRKTPDLSGHLEAWRNHPLTTHQLGAPNRLARHRLSATRVHRAKVGPGRVRWERTREWLRNQNTLRHSESKYFLPEIATDAASSGRLQCAMEEGCTDHHSSRVWTFDTLLAKAERVYKNAQGCGTEKKQGVAIPWKKERISFRDEPTRRSSGWGGGKKRDKIKH
ncbi:leucine-rich repeat and IQ domain-containing protein 1 isoform X2 [Corythoichthys intestinalis]|nr:leucine-rich repeat and IQ domain-containing protein 1 isoform X2 [Corythoichthys intestinalis]